MTYENYMKFKYQGPQIKLFCRTARLNHFHIVSGCSHITMVELSSCDKDRDCAQKAKNVY